MSDLPSSKDEIRRAHLTARRGRSAAARVSVAEALAQHAAATAVLAGARRAAVYLSTASEPGTGPLIEGFLARGTEVLVPVVRDDGLLDWVLFDPAAVRTVGGLGISEPEGERLGPDAVAGVDVVVLPALAVDHAGRRLGRGAGYYDRALAGLPVVRCAVVHADELLPVVPSEPHDVPVDLVLTEAGVFRIRR
ncbi:5-formyltetrahydrofolate cyclo-ligase [Aeromicrobium marinum DSM 15272]|uniref:5-formyltetrahydrofolate cyclo-ligase n=1 Tax=Aeromicrobium marinum DSM 15272 TaxID=585531 RepID=E2SDJ2_9ACTN|nr:5-formyltetrahydrofolate cyclo-ligase [Aeromicrobium marinum]EFQ82569.1 5-formyltetrahydrofolate cyclo-ligase [Aeromicrobium marinum DSM 15272]